MSERCSHCNEWHSILHPITNSGPHSQFNALTVQQSTKTTVLSLDFWRRLCKGIINTLCYHASLHAIACGYRNEAKVSLLFLNSRILTTSIIWCSEMPNFTRTVSVFFNTGWSSGSYLANKNVNSLFSSSSVTSFTLSSWNEKTNRTRCEFY